MAFGINGFTWDSVDHPNPNLTHNFLYYQQNPGMDNRPAVNTGGAAAGGTIASRSGNASAGAGGGATPSGYVLNPKPQQGNGPFGAVPGPIGLPNPAGDLAGQVPGLSNLNRAASSNILQRLNSNLSNNTINALKNASAQFGIQSGMPGSQLSQNQLLGNIAGATEALQTQGLQDYNSFIPTVSGTQTVNPALQSDIADRNSVYAAAPNPTEAASYAESLYNKYLSSMRGPGGGTFGLGGPGGGTLRSPVSSPSRSGSAMTPTPQTVTPFGSGESRFFGSSSFDPDKWAQWEDEMYGAPNQGQGSYGVLAPEFDPNYQPYQNPSFNFDDLYDFDY